MPHDLRLPLKDKTKGISYFKSLVSIVLQFVSQSGQPWVINQFFGRLTVLREPLEHAFHKVNKQLLVLHVEIDL